jgi:hypothetical protein
MYLTEHLKGWHLVYKGGTWTNSVYKFLLKQLFVFQLSCIKWLLKCQMPRDTTAGATRHANFICNFQNLRAFTPVTSY